MFLELMSVIWLFIKSVVITTNSTLSRHYFLITKELKYKSLIVSKSIF